MQSDIVRVNISAIPRIADPIAWAAAEAAATAAVNPSAGVAPATADSQHVRGLLPPGAVLGRVQRVGEKAHGLVPWQGGYIMLDSDNGALIALDLTGDGAAAGGTEPGFRIHRIWKAPEAGV
jgi:hypothetical protein